jgi:hypothetical protein
VKAEPPKTDQPATSPGKDAAPSPTPVRPELLELEVKHAELLSKYRADHPTVKAIEKKIEFLKGEIAAQGVAEQKSHHAAIGADELVTVSIMDLVGPGVETVKTSRVDDDGSISLPYVGAVKAKGLRSVELEKEIAKAYKEKNVVANALVVVSLPGRGESHTLTGRKSAEANVHVGVTAQPTKIDPAVTALLDKKLPEVSFDGVGLSDVVDFLRDVTAANIFVDWRNLEEAGIDRNAPVVARLRDVAFRDALTLVLRGVDRNLVWTVENNVIQIAAGEQKRTEKSVLRAYDARETLGSAVEGGQGEKRMSELMTIVSETLKLDMPSYGYADSTGRINVLDTKLVVNAPEPVQKQVTELLKALHDDTSRSATKPAADRSFGGKSGSQP